MAEEIFHSQAWTPKIQKTAQNIIDKIHSVSPELRVLFMGAAALGLPGKNDIDLDILCDRSNITIYTEALLPVLGSPKDTRKNLTAWEFEYQGFTIDVILSDPATSHVPEQKKVFDRLKSDPDLLDEYKRLKEACDGIPYTEYEQRKKDFFINRVLDR